ncbi:MAG TPA: hypothetical protein VGE94_11880 [Chloroflexota bacterium]
MVKPSGVVVLLWLATLLLSSPGHVAADETLPIDALRTAVNAGDIDAASALFTDDAVVIQPRIGGLPQLYGGQQQLRWWLAGLAQQHISFGESPPAALVDGHYRWPSQMGVDALRQLGLDTVDVDSDITLAADGRITALIIVYTPGAARRLLATGE